MKPTFANSIMAKIVVALENSPSGDGLELYRMNFTHDGVECVFVLNGQQYIVSVNPAYEERKTA